MLVWLNTFAYIELLKASQLHGILKGSIRQKTMRTCTFLRYIIYFHRTNDTPDTYDITVLALISLISFLAQLPNISSSYKWKSLEKVYISFIDWTLYVIPWDKHSFFSFPYYYRYCIITLHCFHYSPLPWIWKLLARLCGAVNIKDV